MHAASSSWAVEGMRTTSTRGRVDRGSERADHPIAYQPVQPRLHGAACDAEGARGAEHADVWVVGEQGEEATIQIVYAAHTGHSAQPSGAQVIHSGQPAHRILVLLHPTLQGGHSDPL